MPRLPFLEGLRGLAALYVAIGHVCSIADPSQLAGRRTQSPTWLLNAMAPFQYGHLAVAAFIVLSGFCLEISLFTRGDGRIRRLGRFFGRRALRILPAYYACLALSMLVTIGLEKSLPGMPFDQYRPVTPDVVQAHLFLYHNFREDWMYKINGVLWSISIEAQLYLFFPPLVAALNRLGRVITVLLAGGLAIALAPLWANPMKSYVWFLPLFAAGMAGAHWAFRPHLDRGASPANGFLVGVAMFIASAISNWLKAPIYVTDLLFGMGVVGGCYGLSTIEGSFTHRLLSNRAIVGLGTFSYSLYLMHHPILQVLFAVRPSSAVGEAGIWTFLMLCLPVVLLGSWVFSLAFERPFIAQRPKDASDTGGFYPTLLPLQTAITTRAESHVARTADPE